VLGDFRLDGVDLAQLRSRKARLLLKVLAVAGGATVSGDSLVEILWSDVLPDDPAGDLAVLISRARALVGTDRIVRREGGYALVADWFDRDELALLSKEAVRRESLGDVAGSRAAAETALGLVRGELLSDETAADWLMPARIRAAALVAETRAVAASAALAGGQFGDAATHARAALEHDPYDEVALRLLMRAHVAAGRPASALAAYAETRTLLAEELGVSPSAATETLHGAILAGDLQSDAPRQPAMPAARLLGRQHELDVLDQAFSRSRGGAEVVVVTGEAGAGKTTLLEAWTSAARRRGVLVLTGRAEEGVGLALQPVVDALATHLTSIDGELRFDTQLDALLGAAPSGMPADARTWAVLPGPTASTDALSLGLFESLARLLQRLAPPSGLVIVIDDVHLVDALTRAWMSYVLRRRLEHRFLVIAAQRDEEQTSVAASIVVRLGPLALDAVIELVGDERAAPLLERTGGNALLLVELAAAADTDDVPATVLEAVAGRLRRAGDAAATLRVAAVLGPIVDLDLVAGITDRPPIEVLGHLDEGTRRSFLTERDGILAFRHELVRAAVAADTSAMRRAWVHRQAARLLAARHDVHPMELARHARQGGDRALAASGLADAAEIARGRFDLAGAEDLLDEAIALHDSAEVRLRRSRLRMARADLAGADSDAERSLALGGGAEALELRAWAARNRHDTDAAIRLGEAGAAMAGDPGTKASCLLAVAFAYRGVGDLPAAERLLGQARGLDPPPSLGLAAWLGVLRVHQGRPAEGLAALEPLLGVESGSLQSFWVEHVLQMSAHGYGMVGRAGDALAVIDRMAAELERRGSKARYGGSTDTYRSWVLRNVGAPEAEDHARAGLEHGASNEIRGQGGLDLAEALMASGRLDDAGAALDAAAVHYGPEWVNNRWRCQQRAGIIAARLHLANGSPGEALDAAEAVAGAAGSRGEQRYTTLSALVIARANARLGRAFDAESTAANLERLMALAAMEAWWFAADVGDDTRLDVATVVSKRAATRLADNAGAYRDSFSLAAARRLG
jgi:DNA-binding SARP family transcriptional activator